MLITVGDGKIKLVGATSGRPRDASSIQRPPRGLAYDFGEEMPMRKRHCRRLSIGFDSLQASLYSKEKAPRLGVFSYCEKLPKRSKIRVKKLKCSVLKLFDKLKFVK